MNGLITAFRFLTVLPVGSQAHWHPAGSTRWYPVVGVFVGGLSGLAAWGAAEASPALGAVTALAGLVVLTGALHLDGLADCADAAFAPLDRARRVEILTDVRHGTFAVTALGLVLLAQFAALVGLSGRELFVTATVAAVASRAALLGPMLSFPVLRPDGFGAAARPGATVPFILIGALLLAAIAVMLAGPWAALALVGLLAAYLPAAYLTSRLGGLNGDCYGALIVLVETGVIIGIATAFHNNGLEALPWAN